MLRRIKKIFGFSTRGTYFPNNEVAPADGSVISTNSRKSAKSEKKSKKIKKNQSMSIGENPNESQASSTLKTSTGPISFTDGSSPEVVIGGEESVVCSVDRNTIVTDSLPYREPSDKSNDFSNSQSSNVVAESVSTRSLIGSETTSAQIADEEKTMSRKGDGEMSDSFVESVYSTDMINMEEANQKDRDVIEVRMEYGKEMPVDCAIPDKLHSDASSLCVNMPETPNELEDLKKEEIKKKEQYDRDRELERKWNEMNEQLNDLLKKPAPFQVSTARLPPMHELSAAPIDDSVDFSIEDFEEKDNSVTRMLNESHETSMKSPENKHLRSYGY